MQPSLFGLSRSSDLFRFAKNHYQTKYEDGSFKIAFDLIQLSDYYMPCIANALAEEQNRNGPLRMKDRVADEARAKSTTAPTLLNIQGKDDSKKVSAAYPSMSTAAPRLLDIRNEDDSKKKTAAYPPIPVMTPRLLNFQGEDDRKKNNFIFNAVCYI